MSETSAKSKGAWYVVQTLSGQESKVKKYLDKFIVEEEMEDYVFEVLVPTETVVEVKNGKKTQIVRKLYPGYAFVHMRLYDDDGKLLNKPWYFVRDTNGVIKFAGEENGQRPTALKKKEIDTILSAVEAASGKEVPKIQFEVGEEVKINDGPFLSLNGRIDEIDPEKGKLKVSVSIFGRFTPVELEYWQVERLTS